MLPPREKEKTVNIATCENSEKIRFANMIIYERKQDIRRAILREIPFQLHPALRNFLIDFNSQIELELVSGAYTVENEFPILYGAIEDQFWDWSAHKYDNPLEWDNYPTP